MKKLTRKLFLSVAALAVCAATLVSTTFAWYVNNPIAYVNDMTGSTATAGTTGSISVSKAADSGFGKTISFASESAAFADLKPIHASWTSQDGYTFVDETSADANAITFTFYVKADANGTATLKIGAANRTEQFTSQTAHTTEGVSVAQGAAFYVDALQAMRMSITTSGEATATYEAVTASQNAVLDCTSWKTLDASNVIGDTTYAAVAGAMTGGNAHEYYEEVKADDVPFNETTVLAATTGLTTSISSLTLKANEVVTVEVNVWLEGADLDCFNSCQLQDFAFAFQLDFADAV